jgi:IBR domain, a half RING-finger domain
LGEKLADLYAEKRVEYNTEGSKRVYCYKCKAFVMEGRVERSRAVCEKCGERTCAKCKRKYHGSSPCPMDKKFEMTLKLVKKEDWRKCPKCGRVIDRVKGTCNTIM